MRALLAVLLAVATTGHADNIGTTTATIHGTVDPDGVPTTYHFEYGATDQHRLTTEPEEVTGSEPVEVKAELTGLTADTEYHYRLVAGTSQGADAKFRTAPNPQPPRIVSQRAPDRGVDAATLTASIDANGGPTTVFVEYGTTMRYGSRTPDQDAGAGADPAPASVRLAGLQPRTRYHYRFVASNAAGIVLGRDRTFSTRRLPTGVSLGLSPRRVTWGRGLTLGGRVSGIGVARTPLALEVQRFPFDAGFADVARTRAGDDGGYAFQVGHQWTHSRYRVVTRTRVVAVSPVVESFSAVLVGRRVRHTSRRRARLEGSALPGVTGTASLQRRSRRGRWVSVRRRAVRAGDELRSRYRFRVRRVRRTRRYRVVVVPEQGGPHVRGTSRTVKVRPRRT
ncbi:MAG: hypothetical protein ACRDPC_00490 [Solirubrobacteraceae bacterium]